MDLFRLLLIALGLAMDAFAVAIGVSVALRGVTRRQLFRLGWHFGLFQALMPILGWGAGNSIRPWIESWDHWLAFGLLGIVGGRMIVEALRDEDPAAVPTDPTRGWSLVGLSVATSIDALAVGLSFAALGVSVWYPALIIGLVAGCMTVVGALGGCALGRRFGSRMAILGGLVLLAIGIWILIEHLTAP
jgi:putative Mn2+ efflux pump MntP